MIDIVVTDERKSRVKELGYDKLWESLREEQYRSSYSVLNDESTYFNMKFLSDISTTLALIYDEMRGVKDGK